MTAFFTSDTHFGHANVITFGRPFSTVEEMDGEIVRRWNERVTARDDVYHLGDFTLGDVTMARRYWALLNGRIHLVHGNHDRRTVRAMPEWASSQPYLELNLNGTHVVMSHYAMRVWNRSHRGALMLYGHSHGNLPGSTQSLDVGVDAWGYRPVTIDEVLARMASAPTYGSVDHHRKGEGT